VIIQIRGGFARIWSNKKSLKCPKNGFFTFSPLYRVNREKYGHIRIKRKRNKKGVVVLVSVYLHLL
jgi:hypothetical protein